MPRLHPAVRNPLRCELDCLQNVPRPEVPITEGTGMGGGQDRKADTEASGGLLGFGLGGPTAPAKVDATQHL